MAELIWYGKYDKDGRRVAAVRVALPFLTIETVNESAQERQGTLDLFSRGPHTALAGDAAMLGRDVYRMQKAPMCMQGVTQ